MTAISPKRSSQGLYFKSYPVSGIEITMWNYYSGRTIRGILTKEEKPKKLK